MALFSSKGKGDSPVKASMSDRKLPDSEYRSTMKADDPLFFSKLDKNVSVIIKNENNQDHFIDHAVYICFSGQARSEQLKRLKAVKGDSISATMMRLGTVLKSALERQDCRAVFLFGLNELKQVVAKRDLEEIKELIDGYDILYRRALGEITTRAAYDMLKKSFVYVIGEIPRTDANGMRNLDRDTNIEKFKWIGDDARISAMCYLDKRTAKLAKPDTLPSSIRLAELAEAFRTVILEPNSGNWLEFYLDKMGK